MKLIQAETEKVLNELLGLTFQGNSFADNCAYNLSRMVLPTTEKIFHEKYAHQFPVWADMIGECMVALGANPIRKELQANVQQYASHTEVFKAVEEELIKYREKIYEVIEIADMHNDREVINCLDDLLTILVPYFHQVHIWATKADRIDKIDTFDDQFEDFTII